MSILFIISLVALPYLFYKSKVQYQSYQFNGRVDSVLYNVKGEPTVKIGDKKYHLPVHYWTINRQIQVGDSLVKEKNSITIRIVKKDGTVIIKD
ncbi:hypothetical protein ACPPVU_09000 [Mucilaginibacter sp. McL0603]|uniref:hypothetical protein n=1 Tax=Mucilaginibacter sp. McL0603 TaxID=3415670 RepID=UPI003CE6F182